MSCSGLPSLLTAAPESASEPSDSYPLASGSVGKGRSTLVHEIGHQLGLGHFNDFNMMTIGTTRPSSPLGPVPYPDDVAGVAALYGPKAFTNLFTSGQRWSSSDVLNNHELTESVCLGSDFLLDVTVVNPGSTDATYAQQILLDDSADGLSPEKTFGWSEATTGLRSWSTFAFSVSTAGVSPGTYFIFHEMDPDQLIPESREDDNQLRYTGKLIVEDCGNSLATFESTRLLVW